MSLAALQSKLEDARAKLPRSPAPRRAPRLEIPKATWACPGCGEPMAAPSLPSAQAQRCHPCTLAALPSAASPRSRLSALPVEERAEVPLEDVLRAYGWPEEYRQVYERYEYPRDVRPDRREVDLGSDENLRGILHFYPRILIKGHPGTGKTALASHLLARLWRAGCEIHYRAAEALPGAVWRRESPLPGPGALLIDDLEHGIVGQAWGGVWPVIDRRFRAKTPLVITTNLSMSDLTSTYGALADRLRSGLVLEMLGKSRR